MWNHRLASFLLLAISCVSRANGNSDSEEESYRLEAEQNDSFFIEPGSLNLYQLGFLTIVYAVILYQSSNLISDGSELLLLVPSIAGLVGSIVLPILGAVPDGMMTLCSGLGPDAQSSVAAGVGVMSGSTVMLLTFPWFIACFFGRVPMKDGEADYKTREGAPSCLSGGVTFGPAIRSNALIMLLTTGLFLIIQVPSWKLDSVDHPTTKDTIDQADKESSFALIGMGMCCAAFMGYLIFCFIGAKSEDKELDAVIEGIKSKTIGLGAALRFAKAGTTSLNEGSSGSLVPKDAELTKLRKIVRPFFARYDVSKDGNLDSSEFIHLCNDLGFKHWNTEQRKKFFDDIDNNKSGDISFAEFVPALYKYMAETPDMSNVAGADDKLPAYDDDEEEEEMPEEWADLPPAEQKKKVIFKSCWMMGLGTAFVLAFSDPLVDCLTEWGNRLGISPFYVAFVLAPFASNASELLSAYNYAVKKTSAGITTALSTLVGAAIMNNTFCLAVMYLLVYWKGLAWQFKAETISIIVVQWIIGILAIVKNTHTVFTAIIIIACYPASLLLVKGLEGMGLD